MDVRPPKKHIVNVAVPRPSAPAGKARHPLQFVPLAQGVPKPSTQSKQRPAPKAPVKSRPTPRQVEPAVVVSPRAASTEKPAAAVPTAAAAPAARPPRQDPASPDEQLKSSPLQPAYRLDFTAPEGYRAKRRWWQNLLFPVAILLCLSASFVVQSLPLGVAVIALYAAVAWIRKIPSRVSFIMAFLAIVTVVALLLVRQNVDLASNFSTYTFLLLVVGVVSTLQESRVRPKQRRSKIPHLHG